MAVLPETQTQALCEVWTQGAKTFGLATKADLHEMEFRLIKWAIAMAIGLANLSLCVLLV